MNNKVIILKLTHVSFIVTRADIIHVYTCLSPDVKYDVYLGRLNSISVFINREDTFYSQCLKICGILHSSIPIIIKSVFISKFITWL